MAQDNPEHDHQEPYELSDAPAEPSAGGPVSAAPGGFFSVHRRAKQAQPAPGPSRTLQEPLHRSVLISWLLLCLCVAAAAPIWLVDLTSPDVTDGQEAASLATARETWHRHHQAAQRGPWDYDSLVPYLNGLPRLQNPPGLVWAQAAAATLLSGGDPTAEQMIRAGRLLSVVMAMLTVTGVFWVGHSLGGPRTASFAALICAANPLLAYQARLATAPVFVAGLTTLAVAAALWAIRPLKVAPSVVRQGLGWALCGLAAGAATLAVGFSATLEVAVPVLLILLLCPHRMSHLLGLLAALLIAALLIVPWAAFAQTLDHNIWSWWTVERFDQHWLDPDWATRPVLLTLAALLPWTVWLLGALIQPLSSSSAGTRLRLFLGWTWFIAVFLLLLVTNPNQATAALLLTVPASAALISQLFSQYHDLAGAGRFARFWRVLRWPHLLLVSLLSLALPAFLIVQPTFVDHLLLAGPVLASPGLTFEMGIGLALLALVALSLGYTLQNHPIKALLVWCVWAILLLSVLALLESRGPGMTSPIRLEGARVAYRVGDQRVYWLRTADQEPDPALVLYGHVDPQPIDTKQVSDAQLEFRSFFVLAPIHPGHADQALRNASAMHVVERLAAAGLNLWQFTAPASQPEPAQSAPETAPTTVPATTPAAAPAK